MTVAVRDPADLDLLADDLSAVLEREEPFALSVVAPGDIDTLQRMLWAAPAARRRLRRLRASLAAWCEGVAHVLTPTSFERALPSTLRGAELIWGCATIASTDAEEAEHWLGARLASRVSYIGETIGTAAVPLAAPAI